MPRPQLYDDALRADLVHHAATAIAEGGVANLSLRSVAAAAGTSTNAVYTLFGGRPGLVDAALSTAAAGFTAAQRAVPVTDDPVADLLGLGRAYRSWAVAHPELYTVMFGGRVPMPPMEIPPAGAEADESINPLVQTVLRLVDRGVFSGAPVEHIVQAIWASVHGMVSLEIAVWRDRAESDKQALYLAQLRAIVRGWST